MSLPSCRWEPETASRLAVKESAAAATLTRISSQDGDNVVRIGMVCLMASLERVDLDNLTILKLKGSLTSEELESLEEPFASITQRPGARVVIDLTGVEMVTTPALSLFVAAATSAKRSGGKVVFTETTPPVRDVLQRLRLHSILQTVPGLEEAITRART